MNNTMIDLSGTWSFALDPDDRGLMEAWYVRLLGDNLQLPGSLQAQGFGPPVTVDTEWTGSIFDQSWFSEPRYELYRQPDTIKVPFWLQPDTHYQGAAWYSRRIDIPDEWRDQRLTLTLERAHWETQLWIDDREIGLQNSLSAPHVYDLGTSNVPGAYRLTIRVDNRLHVDVGPNAHSVSDHTQTNWNGIVGSITLAAGSPVWIDGLQVYPHVARKAATVKLKIGNGLRHAGQARVTITAQINGATSGLPLALDLDFAADGTTAEIDYLLGDDAQLWDEFHPALYTLELDVEASVGERQFTTRRATTFGLREISVQGTQLAINGRPIFLRGTLECCIFPLTGYPPTDVDSWKRIIEVCKAHGLNHIRFHSWCPPAAAFLAADELGFYYQVECAAWANQGTTVGDGAPLDAWLYDEGQRIIDAYGNHPSFILMAHGNEPAGEHHEEYLTQWVRYWKAHEPRRLHTTAAGWPAVPENDYHNYYTHENPPRLQGWGQGLNSRINASPPETRTDYSEQVQRLGKPLVSHEIGQWCVYPNFDEIGKYTGYLKAHNFEIFRDSLQAHHMGDQAHAFLIASGKLQTLCYKEEIESALRTPGFGGFQLLDLHDFPGQGTALVGVLDPFWDEKGYVTAQAFSRFCNSTVPLARLDKRYWRTGETLVADIDIAHFGPEALQHASVQWQLNDIQGVIVAQGNLPKTMIPTGGVQRVGTLTIDLADLAAAQTYTLLVGVDGFENDWDVWVFADDLDPAVPDDILILERLDGAALARLADGGKVLLLPPIAGIPVQSTIGFSSVFWNTAWTNGQAPHTLGIVCDPAHPVFAQFPTESHSNWQWWELIHGAAAMTLETLPGELRPLVQPIDTWFENRRLGLLFEAQVNGGKLLVCSMDLRSDLDTRLVARQLRRSVLDYMGSERFEPRTVVDVGAIRGIVASR